MIKQRGIWRANPTRPLRWLVLLFSMLFSLAGCERKPLTKRYAGEPDRPNAARVESHASLIPNVHPLVDAGEAMLFGAASDGRWLPAESAVPLIQEGMKYGLYTLTRRLGESRGGKASNYLHKSE